MPPISAEEWQLLSFFEVEPKLRDKDVPWLYNDALYEVRQGETMLSVAIAPSYRDVRLIVSHQATKLHELNALGVEDIRYRNEDGIETLEIVTDVGEHLTLRIKPHIELSHRIEEKWAHRAATADPMPNPQNSDYLRRRDVQPHLKVQEVLREWDPIGVISSTNRDEYDRYAPELIRMLDAGASTEFISKWLIDLACNYMGLSCVDKKRAHRCAETLTEFWKSRRTP